ncbi:hypothetical protein [Promineifilum sp.]
MTTTPAAFTLSFPGASFASVAIASLVIGLNLAADGMEELV